MAIVPCLEKQDFKLFTYLTWTLASGSILQTRYQQGLETQGSGDISEARIQDTGMKKVKSQLQPLSPESEAPIILSVDTKTEDGNSVCKGGNSPSNNSIMAPLEDLEMLPDQVVCASCTYDPFQLVKKFYVFFWFPSKGKKKFYEEK